MIQDRGLSVSIYNAKEIHKKAKEQAVENQISVTLAYQDRSKASLYAIGSRMMLFTSKRQEKYIDPPPFPISIACCMQKTIETYRPPPITISIGHCILHALVTIDLLPISETLYPCNFYHVVLVL